MPTYDLIVIESGPAGQRAAIQAAKAGKQVALIEKREVVGGVCINVPGARTAPGHHVAGGGRATVLVQRVPEAVQPVRSAPP